jgi:hypothetical protein
MDKAHQALIDKARTEGQLRAINQLCHETQFKIDNPNGSTPESVLSEFTAHFESIFSKPAGPEYKLSGRTVLDFLDIYIDPKTNLAGNRWLTTDGSAIHYRTQRSR